MSESLPEFTHEGQPNDSDTRHPPSDLQRYRSLVGHLICESLGYFTPKSALRALQAHQQEKPFACEWYSHMAMCQGKGAFHEDTLVQINRETIDRCFQRRQHHSNYMSEYEHAKALVKHEITEEGSTQGMLASWF